MADRYDHPEGQKSQDITLKGKRLEVARKGRKGHEASKLAEKGVEDRDKAGVIAKRTKKIEKVADKLAPKKQAGVSGYLKSKKDVTRDLDAVFE